MSNSKYNDLRYRRTEGKIYRALVELLRKKDFEKITVNAIVKRAKISRGSFYLHYQDKFELMDHYRALLISQVRLALVDDLKDYHPAKDYEELTRQFAEAFQAGLGRLSGYLPLLRIMLKHDNKFQNELKDLLYQEIAERMELMHVHYTHRVPERYAQQILAGELLLLIEAWADNPHPESGAALAKILIFSRVTSPLNVLEKDQD